MKTLMNIKKGMNVEVITGADKGKKGRILEIQHRLQKVKVQGVRLQKKHDKKQGIQTREGFIDYSNIKLLDKKTKKQNVPQKSSETSQSSVKSKPENKVEDHG